MKIQLRMPFFYFPLQFKPLAVSSVLKSFVVRVAALCAVAVIFCADIFAQDSNFPADASSEDYSFVYFLLIVFGIASLGAFFWMRSKKNTAMYPKSRTETTIRRAGVRPISNAGADKKVDDWLQAGFVENKKRTAANGNANGAIKNANGAGRNANGSMKNFNGAAKSSNGTSTKNSTNFDASKLNSFGNNTTPAAVSGDSGAESSFWQLTPPQPFSPLPSGANDETILDALEQLKEDEDDEMMRSLAIRVLSAAKTQESVEGLAQVALYDQSARHRIEAIMALGAFDHESVFEPVLLAGADPSREVRAAAARALARLSFDRPDAFVRVIGSRDAERLRLAALACVESGFAARAFERLSSSDGKQSYEAFAILTLLIKSGEYRPILQTIAEHPSLQVRLATVKVLHNLNSNKMSAALYDLSLRDDLPDEVKAALNELLFHLSAAV